MKVHHLNCGTLQPLAGKYILGRGGALGVRGDIPSLVCHCLLIEADDGLILVDAGLGLQDIARPVERLGAAFVRTSRPRLARAETAAGQVEALGFERGDVRHVVATHLDIDHIGGLTDFPRATLHVHAAELASATRPALKDRLYARYSRGQFEGVATETYEEPGEPWFGFDAVRDLRGLPPEILLVPLFGHSRGHSGVAVRVGDAWLLHAGDAYFHHAQVEARGSCPVGLRVFQATGAFDRRARQANSDRIAALLADRPANLQVFCSHDPSELAAFS